MRLAQVYPELIWACQYNLRSDKFLQGNVWYLASRQGTHHANLPTSRPSMAILGY